MKNASFSEPALPKFVQVRVDEELDEREQLILRSIVHYYILTATPVGSRILSKYLQKVLKVSPATIRNVMADLEEMGYVTHPHTSAGRQPTDKGYRYYVDSLQMEGLSPFERSSIQNKLDNAPQEAVLRVASKLIGSLSHHLGVVQIPHLSDVVIEKIELLALSSSRVLVVISLGSDVVRTITLEADCDIDAEALHAVASQLSEKLCGRTLSVIRRNLPEMISDVAVKNTEILRLFVDSADKLFARHMTPGDKVHIAGTTHLFEHPEFENTQRVRSIIELIESEEIVVHLLDFADSVEGRVNVHIGKEIEDTVMEEYSLLTTRYRFASAVGTIGLIGPKRMNYSKMISILDNVAKALSVR